MTGRIVIEFRYVDRNTCSRCKKSGENTRKTYLKLRRALEKKGLKVSFKTRKLPLSKLLQSNSVLINGRDLKVLLNEEKKLSSRSICYGCSKLMRKPCKCRTYSYKGKRHASITPSMIEEAIVKILRKQTQK